MAATVDKTATLTSKCFPATDVACSSTAYLARRVDVHPRCRRIGVCFHGGSGSFAVGEDAAAMTDGTTDLTQYPKLPANATTWLSTPENGKLAFGHSVSSGTISLHLDFSDIE